MYKNTFLWLLGNMMTAKLCLINTECQSEYKYVFCDTGLKLFHLSRSDKPTDKSLYSSSHLINNCLTGQWAFVCLQDNTTLNVIIHTQGVGEVVSLVGMNTFSNLQQVSVRCHALYDITKGTMVKRHVCYS